MTNRLPRRSTISMQRRSSPLGFILAVIVAIPGLFFLASYYHLTTDRATLQFRFHVAPREAVSVVLEGAAPTQVKQPLPHSQQKTPISNESSSDAKSNYSGLIMMDWVLSSDSFSYINYKSLESLLSIYPKAQVEVHIIAPNAANYYKYGNLLSKMQFQKYIKLGHRLEMVIQETGTPHLPLPTIYTIYTIHIPQTRRSEKLLLACNEGDTSKVLALLLEGCDTEGRNDYGQTPLHLTVWLVIRHITALLPLPLPLQPTVSVCRDLTDPFVHRDEKLTQGVATKRDNLYTVLAEQPAARYTHYTQYTRYTQYKHYTHYTHYTHYITL